MCVCVLSRLMIFSFSFTQVILVGHSAGGLSVTQATHKFAKKICLAVYVAATMLKSGFLTDEDVKIVKLFYPNPVFLTFGSRLLKLIITGLSFIIL